MMIPYDLAKFGTGMDVGMGFLFAIRGMAWVSAFMMIVGIFAFAVVCVLDPSRGTFVRRQG